MSDQAADYLERAGEKLHSIAEVLAADRHPSPISVREFLEWFGARRRGFNIVERIRQSLDEANLRTVPDFEEPHIDAEINFVPAKEEPGKSGTSLPRRYLSDPIWRVHRLRAANRQVVSVAPTEPLESALTRMLYHDFSQLPVMNGKELKGAVTWRSIGTGLALGNPDRIVKNFVEPAKTVDSRTPLLMAIPEIVENQFVLVVGIDKRIKGIVTTSDLSGEFREQSEPFLLLREIEHQIRQFLIDVASVTDEDLAKYAEGNRPAPNPGARIAAAVGIHDLTFGDYVRIMEDKEWWAQLHIPVDRAELIKNLHNVREIRNSIMHFDPDTFDRDPLVDGENAELAELRRMNAFFQKLLQVLVPLRHSVAAQESD